jgi:uncharacterized membrane protein YqjE
MAIADTARRLGGTLVAMLHTRLELASVELQEEAQRLLGYLVWALLSLFLFGVAIGMVALFVVVLFWESYRLEAIGGMALLFGAAAALIAVKLKASIAGKPRLMADTVAELRKDAMMLRGSHD